MFLGSPTVAASLATRQASQAANTTEGDINIRVAMSMASNRPRLSLAFIATNELGKRKSALCPAPASKAEAVRHEATERIGG